VETGPDGLNSSKDDACCVFSDKMHLKINVGFDNISGSGYFAYLFVEER
jgi:hypothetical protein